MIKKLIITFSIITLLLSCEKQEFQLPDNLIGAWISQFGVRNMYDVIHFDDNKNFTKFYKLSDNEKQKSDSLLYISSGKWKVIGKDQIEINHHVTHYDLDKDTIYNNLIEQWKITNITDEMLNVKIIFTEYYHANNALSTYKKFTIE